MMFQVGHSAGHTAATSAFDGPGEQGGGGGGEDGHSGEYPRHGSGPRDKGTQSGGGYLTRVHSLEVGI